MKWLISFIVGVILSAVIYVASYPEEFGYISAEEHGQMNLAHIRAFAFDCKNKNKEIIITLTIGSNEPTMSFSCYPKLGVGI